MAEMTPEEWNRTREQNAANDKIQRQQLKKEKKSNLNKGDKKQWLKSKRA